MEYVVIFDKCENSYGTSVPDLPGCIAVAETMAEVKLIAEAIEFHIEELREDGEAVPQPSLSLPVQSESEVVRVNCSERLIVAKIQLGIASGARSYRRGIGLQWRESFNDLDRPEADGDDARNQIHNGLWLSRTIRVVHNFAPFVYLNTILIYHPLQC